MSLPRLPFLYPYFLQKYIPTTLMMLTGPSTRFPIRLLERPLVLSRYRHGTAVEPIPTPDDLKKDMEENEKDGLILAKCAREDATESRPTRPKEESGARKPDGGAVGRNTDQHLSLHPLRTPFVHHFDTFGMAKGLESSGFTKGQSALIMKGVRGLLSNNLEVAKESLVSKSNVENVYQHFPVTGLSRNNCSL
jgi:hypothetical protein